MILKVPFYKQKEKYDCGPIALKMALDYLGEKPNSIEIIQSLVDSAKSGITSTLGLAKSSAQLGFKTDFYTTCLGFNPKNYELSFYQQLADAPSEAKNKMEFLRKDAIKFGVHLEERSLSLEEILNKVSESCVPIILLDWSKIKGSDKFIGHFVPIVGYDDINIYVHNQGELNPGPNFKITRDLFEKARKSKGTDEDIVFIHRKS
jgi:hypothetical protein